MSVNAFAQAGILRGVGVFCYAGLVFKSVGVYLEKAYALGPGDDLMRL